MYWVLVTVLMGSPLVNASCPDGLIEHASRIWSIHNGKVEVHFVILSQQHSNAQLEGGDGRGGCREHVRQGQVGGDSTAVSIFVDICWICWIDKYCSEFVNSNNISTNTKTAVFDYYPFMIWSIDHVQKLTFLDHSWSYWAITLDHKMVWKGWMTLENIVESITDPGIGRWNLIHIPQHLQQYHQQHG